MLVLLCLQSSIANKDKPGVYRVVGAAEAHHAQLHRVLSPCFERPRTASLQQIQIAATNSR